MGHLRTPEFAQFSPGGGQPHTLEFNDPIRYYGATPIAFTAENAVDRATSTKGSYMGLGFFEAWPATAGGTTAVVLGSGVWDDSNYRWLVRGSGKIEWGTGAGAPDTTLERFAAGDLKTAGVFRAVQLRSEGNVYVDETAVGGRVYFGSSFDVSIYRGGSDILATDDQFWSAESVVAHATEANQVWIGATASAVLGPGITFGSSMDTNVYRGGADILKTDDNFEAAQLRAINAANQGVIVLQLGTNGAANPQLKIDAAGTHYWGDGSAAQDTNLYRGGANQLKTDDDFMVGNSKILLDADGFINVNGIQGDGYVQFTNEQSSDPNAPAADAARLFIKDNGAGKTQLAVRFNTGATQIIATQP